jgi:hypothetical protein
MVPIEDVTWLLWIGARVYKHNNTVTVAKIVSSLLQPSRRQSMAVNVTRSFQCTEHFKIIYTFSVNCFRIILPK